MSTILEALKKLQREKAAQSPSRDLRGSVTNEPPWPRPRRRGGSGRALLLVALLALVGGGGYWSWANGAVGSVAARFGGGDDEIRASDAELEALERDMRAAGHSNSIRGGRSRASGRYSWAR